MRGEGAGLRRRALFRRVQIALKPASKTLGLHGIFIRGMGPKYVIADSAFKRMEVDARVGSWQASLMIVISRTRAREFLPMASVLFDRTSEHECPEGRC
jgi:hypothetical protein